MAEKIVSPGVFTNEIDLSFLPQGVGEIGAAIVGATKKGPAFLPTIVESFAEFEQTFGSFDETTFVPYTVNQYLQHAGRITIVRTLGLNGFKYTDPLVLTIGNTEAAQAASSSITFVSASSIAEGDDISITGLNGTVFNFEAHDTPLPTDAGNNFFFQRTSAIEETIGNLAAKISSSIATSVSSSMDIDEIEGASSAPTKVTLNLTAVSAGTGGNSFVLTSGSTYTGTVTAEQVVFSGDTFAGGVDGSGGKIAALLGPSANANTSTGVTGFGANSTITGNIGGFFISASSAGGHHNTISASFNPTSDNFILKTVGEDPNGTFPLYVYKFFENHASASFAANSTDVVAIESSETNLDFEAASGKEYSQAYTPYLIDQKGNNILQFYTRADGTNANSEHKENVAASDDIAVKVGIRDIKPAGSIAGSDFGSFTIIVRKVTDTDSKPEVLETFQGVNLDPDSKNFVGRVVGDRYVSSISSEGKITYAGDYPNRSAYIYIRSFQFGLPKASVPVGHKAYSTPLPYSNVPNIGFNLEQKIGGVANTDKSFFGVDFTNKDSRAYMSSIPNASVLNDENGFSLFAVDGFNGIIPSESVSLTNGATEQKQRKFLIGFQGGFDGQDPARKIHTGQPVTKYGTEADYIVGSSLGYDFSTVSSEGYNVYTKAFNALSNPDEFDINMLLTPGLVYNIHTTVIDKGIEMVEDRGDAFYVFDPVKYGQTISTATAAVENLDTNFAATYYPWVKIIDPATQRPTWVPPSVVLAGTIAFTDKVAHEWFAPAGLNRGGLTSVTEAQTRLTHAERDELYENRVNPIATFPGQGVCVWGQKTLQGKPSALDRVNVRRLLIRLKKFIASTTRFLVFEQNNAATRNRFLNVVNPFLESVQAQSGLSAFRVVMDDSNNTPDVIDRNQMVGQIFIQPTRTAEFIVLDFVILPTGAAFPE